MIVTLIRIVDILSTVLFLLILAHVVLSFFMSPYHPVRETVDRIVNPLLAPIRRILPSTGGIDFSPLVLLILVQVIEYILRALLISLA